MNTRWQNMSWGTRSFGGSASLYAEKEALYPDENGTMYSGCGLVNERGMLDLPKKRCCFTTRRQAGKPVE